MSVATGKARIQSIDLVRGFVMILMALDHTRDFFHTGAQHFDPLDLTQTSGVLFLTRWITHYCAPTFMFLAGTGAFLLFRRGRSSAEVSRFLQTRGLWLIVLEITWVLCLGWRFNFDYSKVFLSVIWALGASMIVLSLLIKLPWKALLAGSLAMIVFHNAFDGITPEQFGAFGWLWKILHVRAFMHFPATQVMTTYPLIPWIGVMAAGFCFGRVTDLAPEWRRRFLIHLGAALTCGFVLLRWLNVYGDMKTWTAQSSFGFTLLSSLDCTKYPPSLLYLLMTLGPVIIALGLLEHVRVSETNPVLVFGRVPLFYYLLHIPLIHGLAALFGGLRYGRWDLLLDEPPALGGPTAGFPPDYGYNLAIVYLIWLGIVIALYPLCRWFAALKQRNRSVLLSYF